MRVIDRLLEENDLVVVERPATTQERRDARRRARERKPQHQRNRARAVATSRRNTANRRRGK